jgi:hypothetical protein
LKQLPFYAISYRIEKKNQFKINQNVMINVPLLRPIGTGLDFDARVFLGENLQ